MKFIRDPQQMEDTTMLLQSGDKDTLHTVMHWTLNRFDHLKKKAYLAKYLTKIDIPSDFAGDIQIQNLSQRLIEMQDEFKRVHKQADQLEASTTRYVA